MSFAPGALWDFLKDTEDGEYSWRKVLKPTANLFVCYHKGKEVGFITISVDEKDEELMNYHNAMFKRHENLTLRILMDEIISRHQKAIV